jgi:hypothetical protein
VLNAQSNASTSCFSCARRPTHHFFRLTHAADTCVCTETPKPTSHHLCAACSPARSQALSPRPSTPPSSSSSAPPHLPRPCDMRRCCCCVPCVHCVRRLSRITRVPLCPPPRPARVLRVVTTRFSARTTDARQRTHHPTRSAVRTCSAGYASGTNGRAHQRSACACGAFAAPRDRAAPRVRTVTLYFVGGVCVANILYCVRTNCLMCTT